MIAFPIATKMVVLVLTSVQAIDVLAHKDIPESITNIHASGNLVVYSRYGRNLPDKDGWSNKSDPYMEFIAVDKFTN